MAIRTIKLPYKSEQAELISKYIINYNNVLRFTYNRLYDNNFKLSTKQLTEMQKSMHNVFIDSHFLNSAQHEARQLKPTSPFHCDLLCLHVFCFIYRD